MAGHETLELDGSRAKVFVDHPEYIAMFRELVNVRYSKRRFRDVPLFRTSQWGWFYTCLMYSYGQTFLNPDRRSMITSSILQSCLPYVELVGLLLYSMMLMITVLTLTQGYYKYQIGQLAWTIAIIVITVVQVSPPCPIIHPWPSMGFHGLP